MEHFPLMFGCFREWRAKVGPWSWSLDRSYSWYL